MAVQGKVVIITGAAMGIGRYNARLFAAEGARLALMAATASGVLSIRS